MLYSENLLHGCGLLVSKYVSIFLCFLVESILKLNIGLDLLSCNFTSMKAALF